MSTSSWFPDWLRERARTGDETAGGGPTWDELLDEFGADGCGLFYVLLTIAHGRREFDADPRDVLALVDMMRERFDEMVPQFCERGLVAMRRSGDDVTWTILREPQRWSGA